MTWSRDKSVAAIVLLPFFLLFFLFQLLPLLSVLVDSFSVDLGQDRGWGLDNYWQVLESRYLRQSISHSIRISVYASLMALVFALPCAWLLHRIDGRLKKGFMAFSNMIANFSGVPLAFAFVILFGINGCFTLLMNSSGLFQGFNLYSSSGLILIYTYFQIPLALLLLYPACDALRDEWREAATLLGAGRWQYWCCVGLPVLMPSILATLIILFANAMGTYATAFALTGGSYNLMTIRIGSLVAGDIFLDPWLASALSMYLVVLLVMVTLANEWLIKSRSRYDAS